MIELWTILIAAVTAAACALAGSFLVLRREALVSEGLAHSVLPGIVIAFVLTRDRTSPLLILGAAAMGLAMVLLGQLIRRTGVVDRDASLGVVFPALFSVGVLLANAELADVHFHAGCIIDGNLSLAVLDRFVLGGVDLGPKALWSMGAALLAALGFVVGFFKELKLVTFDPQLAGTLGFRPALLQCAWLALVAVVATAAFETAGSILVVALMIAPPAAAILWTSDLARLLLLSVAFAVASAVAGFYVAFGLDIAPAGPMATIAGLAVLASLVVAPGQGWFARRRRSVGAGLDLDAQLVSARAEASGLAGEELREQLGWSARRFERASAPR
ncbi:MAG: metal ABC transporter permease [Planctomycetota bacterium]|nr:metal ABC transporter permease [Planctomycetota bacterium]